MKVFIKNYLKNGKTIQVLCVEQVDGTYKHYYINVSKNKGTAYITETKVK